jgi:hypothetical protein
VTGTSLIVRGSFKESAYGRQLDCTSIIVDSVSGQLSVVRSFVRKTKSLRDWETEILFVVRELEPDERWEVLKRADKLTVLGLDVALAKKVAEEVNIYFALITTKRGLMEKGFTDEEADALVGSYGTEALLMLDEDPYGIVIERVLAFQRVDAVVGDRHPRTLPRRLHGAIVQALSGQLRNGHTAVPPDAVLREAASIASCYVDAVERVGLPEAVVRRYGALLQLRAAAHAEADIAAWIAGQ